jgi:hypothetical protein
MEKIEAGDLVKVTTGRRETDGIVFDVSGANKVIVAVVDRDRGPVMRTVDPGDLAARAEDAPSDRALRALIRRTQGGGRGGASAGTGAGQARTGHRRAAMHRTTGK